MERIINFDIITTDIYNLSKDSFKIQISANISATQEDFKPTENNLNFVPGDRIYFLPGVNIPRVKLRDILLDNNIKVVRDISQATKIFSGRNTYNKITDNSWAYSFPKEIIRKFIELLKSEDIIDGYDYENVNLFLENDAYNLVVCNYNTKRILENNSLNIYNNTKCNLPSEFSSVYRSYYQNFVENDFLHIVDFIDSNKPKLYDEKAFLNIINGDEALVITEEIYEKLSNMFNSHDSENHTVAMEIMANSKYRESLFYIELLFYNFSHRMRDNAARNHVNFKSLLSYLNRDSRYLSIDVNDIMQSLIDKQVITEEYLDKILKLFQDNIVHSNRYFLVKSLTINDDIFQQIKKNYTRELIPDREISPADYEPKPEILGVDSSEEFNWI